MNLVIVFWETEMVTLSEIIRLRIFSRNGNGNFQENIPQFFGGSVTFLTTMVKGSENLPNLECFGGIFFAGRAPPQDLFGNNISCGVPAMS